MLTQLKPASFLHCWVGFRCWIFLNPSRLHLIFPLLCQWVYPRLTGEGRAQQETPETGPGLVPASPHAGPALLSSPNPRVFPVLRSCVGSLRAPWCLSRLRAHPEGWGTDAGMGMGMWHGYGDGARMRCRARLDPGAGTQGEVMWVRGGASVPSPGAPWLPKAGVRWAGALREGPGPPAEVTYSAERPF